MRLIYMIAIFPAPLHGMAAVNSAMKCFLESTGVSSVALNLAVTSLNVAEYISNSKCVVRMIPGVWKNTQKSI